MIDILKSSRENIFLLDVDEGLVGINISWCGVTSYTADIRVQSPAEARDLCR